MDHLPPVIQKWLEGAIDPQSQKLVETTAQTYLIVLTAISFVASFLSSSVLIALEVFAVGFTLLLLVTVPPWSFLQRYPIKFLPARKTAPL